MRKKFLIITVFILLILNVFLAVNNLQRKIAIFGLRLNNRSVSLMDRLQMEKIIREEIDLNKNALRFTHQNQTLEVPKTDIGAMIEPAALANQLIKKGRDGTLLQNLTFQLQAILGLKNEPLSGQISQSLLTLKIVGVQSQVDRDAVPVRPDFTGDINKTLPAQDGIKVNINKLTVLIADNIFTPPSRPLLLPIIKTFTAHKEEELIPIRKQAVELTAKPISIISGGFVFTLTTDDLKKLLTLVERPDPKNPKKLLLSLRLDDTRLHQKLGDFAEKVEKVTLSEFNPHDALATIYAQFYSGKRKLLAIATGIRAVNQRVLGTSTGPKVAYLTFDDGPNSIYHPMILDILKSGNVKATFFLVGQNSQRDSQMAKRTAAEGHKIGNHSLTHTFLPNLATAGIVKEIQTTNDILKPFNNNQDVSFFRPPYGGVNLAVRQNAENLHLKMFLWDVDPRDWSEPETDELVRRVVSNTTPGADILLHSNHLVTVKALPKIIETLRGQGFSFETLN